MPLLVLSSMSPLIYGWDKKIFLKVAHFIYTYIFTPVLPKRRPSGIVALFWNLLNLDPVRSHLLVQNLKSFINYVFVVNSLLETCNHPCILLAFLYYVQRKYCDHKKNCYEKFSMEIYNLKSSKPKKSVKKSLFIDILLCAHDQRLSF